MLLRSTFANRSRTNGSRKVDYQIADVRSADLVDLFKDVSPDVVVHLASIVTPAKGSTREFEYSG